MKKIAVLFVFAFGLSLIGMSETFKDFQKEPIIERADTISFKERKYLISYDAKSSKYKVKIDNDLRMDLLLNSQISAATICRFVAAAKVKGAFTELPKSGNDLKEVCAYFLSKVGEVVFVSQIDFKDEKGNITTDNVSGFKITRLE